MCSDYEHLVFWLCRLKFDTTTSQLVNIFILTPLDYGRHHSELYPYPTPVAQELSTNGSILAQPSPYRNHSLYPTSVVLSPTKNRTQYQRNEAASVNSVPSMSTVTSSSSHHTVAADSSVNQSSLVSHDVPMPAAPPPLNATPQPHPSNNILSSPRGGIYNNAVKYSVITKETHLPSCDSNSDTKNRLHHEMLTKDPSAALVEQHNVRVVPAVLSFGSLSSFSLSTTSMSQHGMPQSSAQVDNSASVVSSQPLITSTPSLFKPSEIYNSPSVGHLGNTVSWLHPNKPLFADTSTSQWSGNRSDTKVCVH